MTSFWEVTHLIPKRTHSNTDSAVIFKTVLRSPCVWCPYIYEGCSRTGAAQEPVAALASVGQRLEREPRHQRKDLGFRLLPPHSYVGACGRQPVAVSHTEVPVSPALPALSLKKKWKKYPSVRIKKKNTAMIAVPVNGCLVVRDGRWDCPCERIVIDKRDGTVPGRGGLAVSSLPDFHPWGLGSPTPGPRQA